MDSGSNVNRPRWAKAILRRYERRLARTAVALVTVNRSLGDLLGTRFGLPGSSSCTTPRPAGRSRPNGPTCSAGAPASARGADRPLSRRLLAPPWAGGDGRGDPARGWTWSTPSSSATARWGGNCARSPANPASAGGSTSSPRSPPDVLPAWVSSRRCRRHGDQASTLNHRLSSPNKLFESIATGLPVVSAISWSCAGSCSTIPTGRSVRCAIRPIRVPSPRPSGPSSNSARPTGRTCAPAACARPTSDGTGRLIPAPRRPVRVPRLGPPDGMMDAPVPQRVTLVLPSTGEFDSRTYRVAGSLAARGHEVTVLARQGPGLPAVEADPPDSGSFACRWTPSTDCRCRPRCVARSDARARRSAEARPPRCLGWPPAHRPFRRLARDPLAPRWRAAAGWSPGRGGSRRSPWSCGRRGAQVATSTPARTCTTGWPTWASRLRFRSPAATRDPAPSTTHGTSTSTPATSPRLPRPVHWMVARMERGWARRADRIVTVNVPYAQVMARRWSVDTPLVVMNCSSRFEPPSPRERRYHERFRLDPAQRWSCTRAGSRRIAVSSSCWRRFRVSTGRRWSSWDTGRSLPRSGTGSLRRASRSRPCHGCGPAR